MFPPLPHLWMLMLPLNAFHSLLTLEPLPHAEETHLDMQAFQVEHLGTAEPHMLTPGATLGPFLLLYPWRRRLFSSYLFS
jgi:hypothetical protein